MKIHTLVPRAMSVIDQYLHFRIGPAVCSIPYYNNKVRMGRISLRVTSGKGSPKELSEETESLIVKHHLSQDDLSDETLKRLLVDNNLGIDCSGFAYHVLNAATEELEKKKLERDLDFINCTGFFGKIRAALRPVQNIDVKTLAHDANSRNVIPKDTAPADMISLVGSAGADRDHVLVVSRTENENGSLVIHYAHSIAYPEDGRYGTGVREGEIRLPDSSRPLLEAEWSEPKLLERARRSKTEIRRLKWF